MPDPVSALKRSAGFHLFRLHRMMHARFEARLHGYGVTPAQLVLLATLCDADQTPSQLAREMQLDRAAVLRTSQRLIDCKLIKKTIKPGAAKSFNLSLTKAGKTLLPKLIAESVAVNMEFMADLSEDERATLLCLLQRMESKFTERQKTLK